MIKSLLLSRASLRALRRGIGAPVLVLTLLVSRAMAQVAASPHEPGVGECATCHREDAWRPVRIAAGFRHAEKRFPLDGAHKSAQCTACHRSLVFSEAPSRCNACHEDLHRGELGVNCGRCHTTRSFVDQARLIQRHAETRFPLRGAHIAVPCESCHPGTPSGQAQYAGRPSTCVACHRTEYLSTTTPAHATSGFSTDCAGCHTSTAVTWQGATFNHNATGFPLTGAHLALTCPTCHRTGAFTALPTACYSCHAADYAGTNNPGHQAASFPTMCESCHTTTNWLGATFNHDANFFPIYSGNHKSRWVACTDCHLSSTNFAAFSCTAGCHSQATTDSRHQGRSGYQYLSSACYRCHPRGSAG